MSLTVRIDIRTANPLNQSQGVTRGAMFAKAARRKRQRAFTAMQLRSTWPHSLVSAVCTKVDRKRGVITMVGAPLLDVGMRVILTRVAPSSGLDDDGLTAALKSVRDGVADYLGIDDRDPRVKFVYEQQRGRRGEYAVLVEFTEKGGGE